VAHLYSRYGAFQLAKTLSTKQLEEYVKAQVELSEKYNLPLSFKYDLSASAVNKEIKANALKDYKTILAEIKPIEIKRAASKKSPKKKASVKKASPSKKAPAKKGSVKKTPAKKVTGKCSDYMVAQLKALAKEKGLKGYSTMKKAELCAALKLK
jgi:hypothetical protein